MQDCEIVLRFFALRKTSNIRGSVRSMLDRCMEDNLGATKAQLLELKEVFESRLKLAHDLFGAHVFQYRDEDRKWQRSQPLYDGVMVAIDRLWPKREQLLSKRSRVVSRVNHLLKRASAFEVVVGKPNTARAVKKRINLLLRAIEG